MAVYVYRSVWCDGIRTSYFEAGRPDRPPVVLLHDGAFGSDAENCWGPLVPYLRDRYWVIAPDLLGHGRTSKMFSFDLGARTQRIQHIKRFLATLAIDAPLLVGNSFGAGMILRAAPSVALPMRGGVAICGTGATRHGTDALRALGDFEPTPEWAAGVCASMVLTPTDEMVQDRFAKSLAPGHYPALAAAKLRTPGASPSSARGGDDEDFFAVVRQSKQQLVLVEGDEDPLLVSGWAQDIAGESASVSARIVPGRHQPQIDSPELVAHIVFELDDSARAEVVGTGVSP